MRRGWSRRRSRCGQGHSARVLWSARSRRHAARIPRHASRHRCPVVSRLLCGPSSQSPEPEPPPQSDSIRPDRAEWPSGGSVNRRPPSRPPARRDGSAPCHASHDAPGPVHGLTLQNTWPLVPQPGQSSPGGRTAPPPPAIAPPKTGGLPVPPALQMGPRNPDRIRTAITPCTRARSPILPTKFTTTGHPCAPSATGHGPSRALRLRNGCPKNLHWDTKQLSWTFSGIPCSSWRTVPFEGQFHPTSDPSPQSPLCLKLHPLMYFLCVQ